MFYETKPAFDDPSKFGIMSDFAAKMTTVVSKEIPEIKDTSDLLQKTWLHVDHFTRPYVDIHQKVETAFAPIKEHLKNSRQQLKNLNSKLFFLNFN